MVRSLCPNARSGERQAGRATRIATLIRTIGSHLLRVLPGESTGRAGGGPAGPRSPILRGARTIEPRDEGLRHRQPAEATGPAEPPPDLTVDSAIYRPELRIRDSAHDPHLLDKGGATA